MIRPRIPDDIYNNRCRYCLHFCAEGENRDFEPREVLSPRIRSSCNILGVSSYGVQRKNETNGEYYYKVYEDGECRSFAPRWTHPGICHSCRHHNTFREDTNYCMLPIEAQKNRRIAVILNDYGSDAHRSSGDVCDKWEYRSHIKDRAVDEAAKGLIPAIFDPKTFKLLNCQTMSQAAIEWAKIAEIERRKTEEKKRIDLLKSEPEQISLF